MASSSETGHGINLSNFKLVIDHCVGFGVKYNPGNVTLSVANMTNLYDLGKGLHLAVMAALITTKGPINEREILFEPLSGLITKALGYLKSCDVSKQIIADAKGLADKIRGMGKKKDAPAEGEPSPENLSTSQMSYVKRAENFLSFIALLDSVADYTPNEVEIKVATLAALAAVMVEKNEAIGEILVPLETARVARDHALYDKDSGIIDVALKCKQYVKSIYGASSAEYKLVSKIKFTRKKE